ncbi:deoxyribose-phosphate aldolase [Rhodospirillum rubrum]|uniref:deoxyribose-phosphate aldolase n=1 Tax=Rhodospirillum rubrum TaxID=1085 RepID=UPI0019051ADE|nr:deoxyribose-phosphate aldolase [Rhodospirillum rubrum]MBK1665301.1 deoxyribose-phosphate aldolase [Rhodospirillum rubrum]MBK1677170.1 deoxyribose-phosphate aldolase [Rhodospirillum rubrum]
MTEPTNTLPNLGAAELAAYIDHTLLRPDAGTAEIAAWCDEAVTHGFKSVCVNPIQIPLVAAKLAGTGVGVCSVIGFPFGASPTAVKVAEAAWVVAHGATEVDMVIDIGALKDGRAEVVRADIAAVKAACGSALLKVIIEACLLDDEQKALACRLSAEAGADFVKTSTGFAGGGATAKDVALMRRTVGSALGVKASGGVRTRDDALRMIAAGASRIGASASIAIVAEADAVSTGAKGGY